MKRLLFAAAVVFGMSVSPASAASIVYTTSGANSVAGTATFTAIDSNHFSVTLENLTALISQTAQELDGLTFRLAGGGSPTLTSVSAPSILDCSSDHVYPCDPYAGVVAPMDGWASSTAAGLTTLAPQGLHPYAIINSSYQLPSSGNGNLANPQHNPFLVGPVVYNYTGSLTSLSDVTFFWGTVPAITTGSCSSGCTTFQQTDTPVPEPASLVLLGSGLIAAARSRLKKRA